MIPAFAARHSMDSSDWYTPSAYVDAAREVMGGIDVDPASHADANVTIKAPRFFAEEDNGLIRLWPGRVFLNPPGGKVTEFWVKLMHEWEMRHTDQAIWIGYSLEQLQTLQQVRVLKTPLDFPICIPSRRIAFVENEAKKAIRLAKIRAENAARWTRGEKLKSEKNGPSHGNYVTYLGPNVEEFVRVFSPFGKVRS